MDRSLFNLFFTCLFVHSFGVKAVVINTKTAMNDHLQHYKNSLSFDEKTITPKFKKMSTISLELSKSGIKPIGDDILLVFDIANTLFPKKDKKEAAVVLKMNEFIATNHFDEHEKTKEELGLIQYRGKSLGFTMNITFSEACMIKHGKQLTRTNY